MTRNDYRVLANALFEAGHRWNNGVNLHPVWEDIRDELMSAMHKQNVRFNEEKFILATERARDEY